MSNIKLTLEEKSWIKNLARLLAQQPKRLFLNAGSSKGIIVMFEGDYRNHDAKMCEHRAYDVGGIADGGEPGEFFDEEQDMPWNLQMEPSKHQ